MTGARRRLDLPGPLPEPADYLVRLTREAREQFRVIRDDGSPTAVRFVEAVNGSGSRYVVVTATLPRLAAESMGGSVLATLVYPWTAAWPFNPMPNSVLTTAYVKEKFAQGRRMSGADLAGVTMTLAHALDGEAMFNA